MAGLGSINKKLNWQFGGRVSACEENGCLVLTGELDNWADIVAAGQLAVNKKKYRGLVNRIYFTGGTVPPMRLPALLDNALEGKTPDIAIIGAGVIGCAIARELARCQLDVLLVDKEADVALHASSRNDGMVHPGLDLKRGTQKHHYNLLGNRMYDALCAELGVPFGRPGQYLGFTGKWMRPLLYLTLPYWRFLGVPGAEVLGRKALLQREPGLTPRVQCGIYFPNAGIVCPYGLTIALAENAVQNGVTLSLETAVTGMQVQGGHIKALHTTRGTVYPKLVINAAGVFCDEVARMAQDEFYSIHPRKGTNAILDKKFTGRVANTIVALMRTSSAKKSHTKGGGIVRTVHDNLLIGPDAVETFDREDFSTTRESVRGTFERQNLASPALHEGEIITYFSGVRAATYEEDFVVCKGHATKNFVHAAGIQSPGLTAAPAIAVDVAAMAVDLLRQAGSEVRENPQFNPTRTPIPHTAALPPAERDALIRQNPDYGVILCRCEEVSRGEILDALRRPIPCRTVDAVKRRVRPGMGRCQGGFCQPLVAQLIAEETGIPLQDVLKNGDGSQLLCGPNKGGDAV